MERVGVGIVGAGNIVRLNARGYLDHDRCDVVAICDPRVDKARALAAEWNVPAVYESLDEMLADDRVDAVEILTPTYLHHDHVLAAIEAGKHVSCQKPIANSVADGRAMRDAAARAGVTFRISECFEFYPPLVKAKELITAGAIGTPIALRTKTVCGQTSSAFQDGLEIDGYIWRFDARSPGGHLFDDMVHKFAMVQWLVDATVTSVQSVVRKGELFFEPTVALFEYDRPDLLGTLEVEYAPNMWLRSKYYGADEFFEVQGTDGMVWVTRCTGEMLDLPPVVLYRPDGTTVGYSNVDADWGAGFAGASRHFVDALLDGMTPSMTPDDAVAVLQLCFATYQASIERRPVDPSTIDTSVSPPWWPL